MICLIVLNCICLAGAVLVLTGQLTGSGILILGALCLITTMLAAILHMIWFAEDE